MNDARMFVVATVGGQEPLIRTYEISSDLPADAVGEFVVDSIQSLWRAGCDPVADGLTIQLTFGGWKK